MSPKKTSSLFAPTVEDKLHWVLHHAKKRQFVPQAVGVFQRNTKLFLVGDPCIFWFANGGGERTWTIGWSSKKIAVIGANPKRGFLYVQYQRAWEASKEAPIFGVHEPWIAHPYPFHYSDERAPVRWFSLPGADRSEERFDLLPEDRTFAMAGVRALWDSVFRKPGRSQVARRLLPPPST